MKKIALYIVGLVVAGIGAVSCSDFLDRNDTNGNYSSDGFFCSDAAVYDGMLPVYNMMYMNNVGGFYNVPTVVIYDHLTPMLLERSENTTIGAGSGITPDHAAIKAFWSNYYTGITRANVVLSGAEPYKAKLTAAGIQNLAEIRVLRAYYYYNLISLFGDVPFFDGPVPSDLYDSAPRTARETIADFLIADLQEAAKDLPWAKPQIGRVNRGFALGLVSRVALLAGSLDFNGKAADYYKIAAAAAKEVIDNGGYKLAANYEDMWNITGQEKADVRSEFLMELVYTNAATVKISQPIGFGQVSRIQGQTGRHLGMMLADTYECIDGKRIDESPLYDNSRPQANRDPRFYSIIWMEGDTCKTNKGFIHMHELSAYKDSVPESTDQGASWHMILNIDKAGASASWASFCNAGTGYINCKYAKELAENIGAATTDIPVMRYAEVLLNYAEAKIELGEMDATVYDAMNQVRGRVGMPNVSADRQGNQAKMRQLVRRERKVEFPMEGLHLFDMRRWKTGALENKYPSYGLPLIKYQYKAGNVYYVTEGEGENAKKVPYVSEGLAATDIPTFKAGDEDLNDIPCYDAYKQKLKVRDQNRYWDEKFQLFPIPQTELDRTTNIKQNPGY